MRLPFLRPRVFRVRQHDLTDCAAACLLSVARHYGLSMPLSRIRQFASTDQRGTNALGLIEAATRLGFTAKGVRGPWECLGRVPTPAIAHVIVNGVLPHFVVLHGVTAEHVIVMDPADGRAHHLVHETFRKQWTGVLILLAPAEGFRPRREDASPIRRFWALARPHRSVMAQAVAGAVAYTVLGLTTAVYVQKIVDHVLVDGNRNLLNLLSMGMLLVIAAQCYLGFARDLLVLRTGQRMDAALILGYYQHLLRLPQRFFDTMRVGEVTSRVNDAVKIRAFINNVSLDLLVSLLVVVFSCALMFAYSWRLTLLMLATIPAYGLVFYAANRLNRRNQRTLMESAAELEAQLVESLGSVSTIKRFGLEQAAAWRTEARLVRLLRPVYRSGVTALAAGDAAELISRVSTVALLWAGSLAVLRQSLSPGELMSFYALVGYLTGPVTGLITANQAVQDALIAADRLFEIMDLEREETDPRAVELPSALVGDIVLQDVVFRYGTRARVFDGLSLTIARGRTTAIVGESGCGKSTLANLLQGLYPVDQGHVRIGSLDVREIRRESLRRAVGVVPQTVDLFAGDVIDNIAVGDAEPDMARLTAICDELGITEFVEALPAGFRSYLGEHGALLSGGQRQRLAIARALYRQPAVLVLDEATSSLDAVSEQFVQRVLQRLRAEGATVLQIAHRLSAVVGADRIVVLEGGRVAEEGTYHELMLREGRFYRLWRHQFGGAAAPPRPPPLPAAGPSPAGVPAGAPPDWIRSI